MDKSRWTRDELAVCARVYRRGGVRAAQAALEAGGWLRSWAAIRDKMRKLGVVVEGKP